MIKTKFQFKTTAELEVPKLVVDQIIGQDEAVTIIKKAAKQRRNVLLIGQPGTGKSMLGQALAELLPFEKLDDVLVYYNEQDENTPLIQIAKRGDGRAIVRRARLQILNSFKGQFWLYFFVFLLVTILPYYFWRIGAMSDIIYAASMISGIFFLFGFVLFLNFNKKMKVRAYIPKLLIDNADNKKAPFMDASGAHAGALLGDVLHDPLQSGGLGTPSHERVVAGMIHKAHKGVLFIDEIANLHPRSQQEFLTAMQEKKYAITGQSERSSGAMTRSEPVPCDFILVAAGTLETVEHMHLALRSRIRGYGYEVFMNDKMDDSLENREKIARFVAQEVIKDGRITHFTKEAVDEIINEAKGKANMAGKLTLKLRELGGLVRAAGDLALEGGKEFVEKEHVLGARQLARTLEQQIVDKYVEEKKIHEIVVTSGERIGRVNGLAIMGDSSGLVLPIEAEVTVGRGGDFIATGKLGTIAKEAVKNVSAIILKFFGEDIRKYNTYIQFLQTYEGVEGDSASIAVATAIISALKKVPVKQDSAMTGSLSIRGEVLAVGCVTQKIEAAITAGIKRVIVPKVNEADIYLAKEKREKIEIIYAKTIEDVLKSSLNWKGNEQILRKIVRRK